MSRRWLPPPGSRARMVRRLGIAAGALALVFLPAAWLGARAGYPHHLREVTGREASPEISCLYCHRHTPLPATVWQRDPGPYPTPAGLAVSPDGTRLFVAAAGTDRLMVVATATGQKLASTEVPGGPHGVAVSPDGTRIAVTATHADRVYLVDARTFGILATYPTAPQPFGVAFGPRGDRLFIATGKTGQLQVLQIGTGQVHGLGAGNEPYDVALAANGSVLAVANRMSRPAPPGHVPISELTIVDPARERVLQRLQIRSAHLSEGVAVSNDGSLVLVPVERVRNLLPITQVARGAVMNSGLLVARTGHQGWSVQLPLDRVNDYYADPSDIELTPDGRLAFIAHGGARTVSVVDVPRLLELVRFELGTGTPPDAVRRGEIVFHDASVTFQSQFSCRSCHPDGHSDGLVWDFVIDGVGRNLVETRSLRGIADTAPFKWNGKNPDLPTQCGPRFAMVLTRSDPIPPSRLRDLVAYIESLPREARPPDARLADAISRGRGIFFRTRRNDGVEIPVASRCPTCHRPPLFTDRLMADVGTGGRFDTPHLLDVANSPPYLHDGRARTLEEIWTVHNPDNRHGMTNDLTKPQLNDLILYLRSL